MTRHLKDIHRDNAHIFYNQKADLSGMQAEDVSGELAEWLQEADVETDDSDSD